MKLFVRWCKFNLVGVMGMAVQLTSLAVFVRWMHGHYFAATAAAIELTLLHNFVWHLHYTWRDRLRPPPWPAQLIRFHLSNGLISMLGNLTLTGVLVHLAHLPVIAANGIAIAGCSIANFSTGHLWAFADRTSNPASPDGGLPQPGSAAPAR